MSATYLEMHLKTETDGCIEGGCVHSCIQSENQKVYVYSRVVGVCVAVHALALFYTLEISNNSIPENSYYRKQVT